jgi:rhamnose transport system ATP-binding protein
MEYLLEMKGITKIFPGVRALDKVRLNLKHGEILALMGENGAGKSTLIKTITGAYKPEEGEIILEGESVSFNNPREATSKGIAAIYQHVTSYPHLTVLENIFIGHEMTNKIHALDWKGMRKRAKELLGMIGSAIDPDEDMNVLTVAQQQMVEIAKALSHEARILIMDEPTAALTMKESEELYKICFKLKDNGTSIIFISHRFEDIYKVADRVTVFRDGKYIDTWDIGNLPQAKLIHAMVGREISDLYVTNNADIGEEVFRVENITRRGEFKNVSFSLHKGEILAMTGLVGAGRTEVAEAVFGVTKPDSGKMYLYGKEIRISHPNKAFKNNIGLLPEDRQRTGLVLEMEIGDNMLLPILNKVSRFGWYQKNEGYDIANNECRKLNVKALSSFDLVSSLSGGNQQKVVVGKLLASDVKILIIDEPTKGIDIAAKNAIYEIMANLAENGYAILMISSEMEEVLGMSDRILVMHEGVVKGIFDRRETDQFKLMNAVMGIDSETQAAGDSISEELQ